MHHVALDGNLIVSVGATQETDGISTKTPTWGWVIRRNSIIAAGTGLYLGDFRLRPGARDLYEIYGNLLVDNPGEALFQGSGGISFHDNMLIGGQPVGAVFRDHDLPLKLAQIFDNESVRRILASDSMAALATVIMSSAMSSSPRCRFRAAT